MASPTASAMQDAANTAMLSSCPPPDRQTVGSDAAGTATSAIPHPTATMSSRTRRWPAEARWYSTTAGTGMINQLWPAVERYPAEAATAPIDAAHGQRRRSSIAA